MNSRSRNNNSSYKRSTSTIRKSRQRRKSIVSGISGMSGLPNRRRRGNPTIKRRNSKKKANQNLIEKLHQILLTQGKNTLQHLGDDYKPRMKRGDKQTVFSEMIEMLKSDENKKQISNSSNEVQSMFHYNPFDDLPDNADAKYHKEREKIKNLFASRIKDGDNTMVWITEMDTFEKRKIYKDKCCCLGLRKKIWLGWAFFQAICERIIEHPLFETVSIITIIVNSIFLASEDPLKSSSEQAVYIQMGDTVFLILYTVEMVLKIIGMGFIMRHGSYLRESWNILDFVIVISGLLPYFTNSGGSDGEGVSLNALRSLRVLRPLKTISSIKNLKSLIETLFNAIPTLVDIIIVLFFVFMIFAIAGLQLFRGYLQNRCFVMATGIQHPDDTLCGGKISCPTGYSCGKMGYNPNHGVSSFDNFFSSFLMVFQITTLEGWAQIMVYVQDSFTSVAVLYFILLVFIGAFFLLNLTLAVITVKFNESQENNKMEELLRLKLLNSELNLLFPKVSIYQKVKDVKGVPIAKTKLQERVKLIKVTKINKLKTGELKKNRIKDALIESNDPKILRDNIAGLRSSRLKKSTRRRNDFESLWDWRVDNPNIVANTALKNSIKFYEKIDVFSKSPSDQIIPLSVIQKKGTVDSKKTKKPGNSSRDSNPNQDPDLEKIYLPDENFIKEIDDIMKRNSNDNNTDEGSGKNEKQGKTKTEDSEKRLKTVKKKNFFEDVNISGGNPDSSKNQMSLPGKKINTASSIELEPLDEFEISDEEDSIRKKVLKFTSNMVKKSSSKALKRKKGAFEKNKMDLQKDEDFTKIGKANFGQIEKMPLEHYEDHIDDEDGEEEEKENSMDKFFGGRSEKSKKSDASMSNLSSGKLSRSSKKLLDAEGAEREEQLTMQQIQNSVKGFSKEKSLFSQISQVQKPGGKSALGLSRTKVTISKSQRKKKRRKKKKKVKLNAEQKKHDILCKELTKMKQEYLKTDVMFEGFHYKPASHFDSILDVMPSCIEELKQKKLKEKLEKYAKTKLKINYKSDLVVKKKRKKKKKHKDGSKSGATSRRESFGGSSNGSDNTSARGFSHYDNTSDWSDSESGFSHGNLSKHSTAVTGVSFMGHKENSKKMVISDITRTVNKKPFPISKSYRAQAIVIDMDAKSSRISRLLNQENEKKNEVGVVNKRRTKAKDFGEESLANVSDKFMQDYNSDVEEEESEKLEQKRHKMDFTHLYDIINELDMKQGSIDKFNWSGNHVLSKDNFNQSKTKRALTSLNTQVLEIWLKGCSGCFATARRYVREFMYSNAIETVLMLMVFANTVILALDGLVTSSLFPILSFIFTTTFTLEMIFKIFGLGIKVYMKDKFNMFDSVVVMLSNVELFINFQTTGELIPSDGGNAVSAFRALRIFRIFRVLRVTRLLRSLRFMQIIIDVISGTLEQFTYISILLGLLIFIFSLLGMELFGGKFDFLQPGEMARQNFDSFYFASITVFQALTMENWQDILFLTMRSSASEFTTAIYLIIWIFLGNYIFLNLFLAVLLDGFDSSGALQLNDEIESEMKEIEKIYEKKHMELEKKKKLADIKKREEQEVFNKIINPGNEKTEAELRRERMMKIVNKNMNISSDSSDSEAEDYFQDQLDKKMKVKKKKRVYYKGVFCEKTFFYIGKGNFFRKACAWIATHEYFETTILTLIVAGSFKLVFETFKDDTWSPTLVNILVYIDLFFTVSFTIESFVKIIRNGFVIDEGSFLRDAWHILDMIIVVFSWVDFFLAGVDIPFIKILRLFRTLRPLRFISHNKSMKIVVNALMQSITAIMNVSIVIVMFWIMFAILGISFLGKKLNYCNGGDVETYYGVSQAACLEAGGTWDRFYWNYDDIIQSFVTLFILSSLEGWPNFMASALDADDAEIGPSYYGNRLFGTIFYVVFVLLGALFLMNLFIGVIGFQFTQEQEKEKGMQFSMMTEEQMKWILIQELIQKDKPTFELMQEPTSKWRNAIFRLVNHPVFEGIIILLIVVNIITMGLNYEGMTEGYFEILTWINRFFTGVFIIECILKLIGLGWQYFLVSWNNFDFSIVIASLLDIVLDVLGSDVSSFLTVGPQIVRVMRVLRVSRLFKLMKTEQLEGINKIIKTLIFSFPSLLNVLLLLFLVYFIASVFAFFLFEEMPYDPDWNNDTVNFNNFTNAILTVFRCSTGEDWHMFMYIYGDKLDRRLSVWSFFIVYIFLSSFVLLNMFQLVVIEQFTEYFFKETNALNSFTEKREMFLTTWNYVTEKQKGKRIKSNKLVKLFKVLPFPLGYRIVDDSDEDVRAVVSNQVQYDTTIPREDIFKQILKWDLPMDQDGYVCYGAVLQAAMRNHFGMKATKNADKQTKEIIKKKEGECLAEIIFRYQKKSKIKLGDRKLKDRLGSRKANPIMTLLFVRMAYLTWKSYTKRYFEAKKEAEDRGFIFDPESVGKEMRDYRLNQSTENRFVSSERKFGEAESRLQMQSFQKTLLRKLDDLDMKELDNGKHVIHQPSNPYNYSTDANVLLRVEENVEAEDKQE